MTTQHTHIGTNGLVDVDLNDIRLLAARASNGVMPIRTDVGYYRYVRTGPLVFVAMYVLWDADATDWSQGTGQVKAWLPYGAIHPTRVLAEFKIVDYGDGTKQGLNSGAEALAHQTATALFYEGDGSALLSQGLTIAQNDYLYGSFNYLTDDPF